MRFLFVKFDRYQTEKSTSVQVEGENKLHSLLTHLIVNPIDPSLSPKVQVDWWFVGNDTIWSCDVEDESYLFITI